MSAGQGKEPTFRLAEVLRRRRDAEGGYKQLARAITEANPADSARGGRDVIDRRKLKKLVETPAQATLSLGEMIALDHYLRPFDEGLSRRPILASPNLLETLAGSGDVTFLLGSKLRDERLEISHWDVKSLAEILRGINSFSPAMRCDIEEVRRGDTTKQARELVGEAGWMRLLDDDGPSLVCLGSPRACHAAEIMLARMTGFDPFVETPLLGDGRPPFHFIWRAMKFQSAFAVAPDTLASIAAGAARAVRKKDMYAALVFRPATAKEPVVHEASYERIGQSRTFGVVAAQRRSSGRIWIVIAGLSGAATYGGALLVDSIGSSLPARDPDRESELLCVATRTIVERDANDAVGRVVGKYVVD